MLFMAAPKINVSGVTEWYKNNILPIVDIHKKSYNKPVKEQAGKERKRRKMKEKIEGLKTWVRDHKKRAAGILVAFLLVIGAGIFGVVGVNSANRAEAENKKTEEIKTAKAETKKETKKKEDKKETEEKKEDQEEKKEETDSKEKDVAGTQETQASETTSQSAGTASAPSSGENKGGDQMTTAGSKQESHTHSYMTPVYGTEQRWVVDQAAWTETVNEPVYEMQERSVCNTCGADITGNTTVHGKETRHDGYHSEWIQVQTGTNTYTIDHPEQGHWESYSVVTGYTCSCGAVQ